MTTAEHSNLRDRLEKEERGSLPSTLIFFGVVILALLLSFHGALIWHGRQVVAAAAQDGLRAAQLEGAVQQDGRAAAEATLALTGNLESSNVTVVN